MEQASCLGGPVCRRRLELRHVDTALRIALRDCKHASVLCKDEGAVARRVVEPHALSRPCPVHDPLPPRGFEEELTLDRVPAPRAVLLRLRTRDIGHESH